MQIKILHISDLHFEPSIASSAYSIDQLEAIERLYVSQAASFDRVIVTGDLTNDHDQDSFARAQHWLTAKMSNHNGNFIGLNIIDDRKLKVVPGNKDFDFKNVTGEFPEAYYKGLDLYNRYFKGVHSFKKEKPITYDWFDGDTGVGAFILYLNTSILGDNSNNAKLKSKYIDYLCKEIREYFEKGLKEQLKKKKDSETKITNDQFRRSFKILVSHHPLQSHSKQLLSFLSDYSKRAFLSNIGIMDFQIQLSGHFHLNENKGERYYNIFDARAKNRFIVNELKKEIGFVDEFSIITSHDGRRFSKYASLLFHTLMRLVDPDEAIEERDIVSEIEKISEEDRKSLSEKISDLIRNGKRTNIDQTEFEKIKSFLSGLDDAKRQHLERSSKLILQMILDSLKKKSITSINAGSSGVPLSPNQDRYLNIYEIDANEFGTTFLSRLHKWVPTKNGGGEFVPAGKEIYKYDLNKIIIKEDPKVEDV